MNVEIEYTIKKTVRVDDMIVWLEEESQSERVTGNVAYGDKLKEAACVMCELQNIVNGNRKEKRHV